MPEISLRSQGYEARLHGYHLYTVTLEETKVGGAGGFYAPHMRVPLVFESLWQRAEEELILCDLETALCLGVEDRADAVLSRAVNIGRYSSVGKFNVTLTMPIAAHSLEPVEDFRNGKDLDLLLLIKCNVIVRSPSEQKMMGVDSASGSTRLQIPRSHWVDKVLPGMGYLIKHIVEISVPSSSALGGSFQRALKELGDAEKDFRNDNYDGVLVNCRNAIDAIASAFKLDLGGEEASYSTRVKAFQEQHLQSRVGSSKAELVADSLLALWRPLSAAAKPGPFSADRPAAKYVLHSTANVLAYLGKVFSE